MLKFLEKDGFLEALCEFASAKPVFATCAGCILLAREVLHPKQRSLGVLDATVERNAYGRQIDSTILTLPTEIPGGPLEMVFIRSPRITRVGEGVEVLARRDDIPYSRAPRSSPRLHFPSRDDSRHARTEVLSRHGSGAQDSVTDPCALRLVSRGTSANGEPVHASRSSFALENWCAACVNPVSCPAGTAKLPSVNVPFRSVRSISCPLSGRCNERSACIERFLKASNPGPRSGAL